MPLKNLPPSLSHQTVWDAVAPVTALRRAAKLAILAIVAVGIVILALEKFPPAPLIERIAWLHIQDLKIISGWPIAPEQVRRWLPPLEGKSLLLVSPSDIARGLKEKTWVEWVTLKKEFPNRLVVEVGTKRAAAIELTQGQSFFIDGQGSRIERASAEMLKALDLPVISRESETRGSGAWSLDEIVGIVDKMTKFLDPRYAISEVVLSAPPLFRVHFTRPRLTVTFSAENWETQLPVLALLLHSPPRQIGQPRKINLVLPKKAVVSSLLSH